MILGLKHKHLRPDFGQINDCFGQLRPTVLTVNNFGTEQDIVNRKSALKTTETQLGGNIIQCTLDRGYM